MCLLGWRTLFAAGKSIKATAWRTAIAAANTRCDNGVIHPLLAVIRGDRASVVGQLDGTGSTKVRHAPPRNGAIELSALEEPDAIPVAAVSANPEPAWNPSSIRGGRTLLKSEIGVALYYSLLVAGEHFIRPHARGPGWILIARSVTDWRPWRYE
jgi:hypothetical protein